MFNRYQQLLFAALLAATLYVPLAVLPSSAQGYMGVNPYGMQQMPFRHHHHHHHCMGMNGMNGMGMNGMSMNGMGMNGMGMNSMMGGYGNGSGAYGSPYGMGMNNMNYSMSPYGNGNGYNGMMQGGGLSRVLGRIL